MRRQRLRDYVLYVLIASAAVGTVVFYAYHVPVGTEFPVRWVGLVAATAFVFWEVVDLNRRYWKVGRFWIAMALLLIAHTAIFSTLLAKYRTISLLLLGFSVAPEILALSMCLDQLVRRTGEKS